MYVCAFMCTHALTFLYTHIWLKETILLPYSSTVMNDRYEEEVEGRPQDCPKKLTQFFLDEMKPGSGEMA